MSSHSFSGRFSVHGLAVEITNHCPVISDDFQHMFGSLSESQWPDGFAATNGTVSVYEQSDVMRHVSPSATFCAARRTRNRFTRCSMPLIVSL